MKESFEYYDAETGFWHFTPGDDLKECWLRLAEREIEDMVSTEPLQFLKDGTIAGYNSEYRCHMFQYPENEFTMYVFETRYYANKWIKDFVPEVGRDCWKVLEIDGYYRVLRLEEYCAPPLYYDVEDEEGD